jgi:serine/threonine protein kinase
MRMTFPKWNCDASENIRVMCKNFNDQAIDLLQQMVHLEPGRRISARAALNHPFFDGFTPESSQ